MTSLITDQSRAAASKDLVHHEAHKDLGHPDSTCHDATCKCGTGHGASVDNVSGGDAVGGTSKPTTHASAGKSALTTPVDHKRIESAVREILFAVGEDPDREGLLETPARVARMYAEMFGGLKRDPRIHLQKVFTEKYDEVVLIRDIDFCSMCEHHLLPFLGKAHVGYMPNGKVVGLSKLARVVEEVARRPQVQERMTEEIADLIETELNARGVAVVLEASHSCMTIRGIRKPGSLCMTSAMRGIFRNNSSSRSEILGLIMGERR